MALVFGKVPPPNNIVERLILKEVHPDQDPPTIGWDFRGQRTPVGTCIHRMDSHLTNVDGFFRQPETEALSDFGIGGQLEIDLHNEDPSIPNLDGVIYKWMDPWGDRSPWANAWTNYRDLERNGPAFENYYGTSAINRELVSIELSGCSGETDYPSFCLGKPETQLTEAQFQSLCWLVAHFHDAVNVPWDKFPVNPASGKVTCLEHFEFSEKNCPYSIVRATQERYHARVREIMAHYQKGGVGATPPPGITLTSGMPGDGETGPSTNPQPGGYAINDKIKVTGDQAINLRADGTTSADIVGELNPGTQLCVRSKPKTRDNYNWYQVRVISTDQTGFVAGELCTIVAKHGCGTGSPPGSFVTGDIIKVRRDVKVVATPGNATTPVDAPKLKPSDLIVRALRGLPETAISFARARRADNLVEVIDYINEVYRLAPSIGFDPAIIVAQSAHETGAWAESRWWRERLNPAGLGVPGIPAQDENSPTFASGVAAARAHLAHMHAEVYGTSQSLPPVLQNADPTYQNVINSGHAGTIQTIEDLTGTWALADNYHEKVCEFGNAIYGPSLSFTAASPATGNAIMGHLIKGTHVCVQEGPTRADNFEWYRIDDSGLQGWIAGDYATIVERGGCTGSGGRFKSTDRIQVIDGPLNLRSGPSLTASILNAYEVGTELCVTGGPIHDNGYEWYQVPAGWVAGDFCGLVRSNGCTTSGTGGKFRVADRIWVYDGPLNLRSGPSLSATILNSYETGTELCVVGGPTYADNYEWYEVPDGWVAGDFCALVAAIGCSSQPLTGRFRLNDRIYVADPPLNLRSAPSTTAPILTEFTGPTELCVLDGPRYAESFEWYRIGGGGLEGWLAGDYCGLVARGGCGTSLGGSRFSRGDTILVIDPPVNLRSGPSTSDSVITTLDMWTDVCVTGGPTYAEGYDWYQVDRFGTQGWVAGIFFDLQATGGCVYAAAETAGGTGFHRIPTAGVNFGDVIRVPEGRVDLHSAASASSSVIADMPTSRLAIVIGPPTFADGQMWLHVDTRYGEGWVPAARMAKARSYTNWVANPTADVDLSFIAPINSNSNIFRHLNYFPDAPTDAVVECQSSGTSSGEGMRYDSQDNLGLSTARSLVGVVDVMGAGVLDDVRVRAICTDGTSSYSEEASAVVLPALSFEWHRIVVPQLKTTSGKIVKQLQLRIRRSDAVPNDFYTDNAKIVQI